MAGLLSTYLAEMASSENQFHKTLENSICDMVKAILRELNDLKSHDDRQKMFDDQLWGLILMSHFKVAKGLTDKEIQLYLLRQEKGHSSKEKRTAEAIAARNKRNSIMKELLYICFRDWTTSKHDSNEVEEYEEEEEVEEEEEGDDNSAGKAKGGVIQKLIKEKRLSVQDAKALRKYEQMFLAKAGMLILLQRVCGNDTTLPSQVM